MFSKRTNWDLTPNALARCKARLEREGEPLLDLTVSNPTQVGIRYPDGLLETLADPEVLRYEPDPKGLLAAREGVATIYEAKGVRLEPERIVLTASTSEAYSFLLRLLADPGQALLAPVPSYPLFSYLADLNDLRLIPYRLRLEKGLWQVDWDELEKGTAAEARAIIAVHPNNPTGSCWQGEELARLTSFCVRHRLALISDEVFAEYRADPELPATLLGKDELLTFSLGGLSKFMGLPQMKLAWIASSGPKEMLREAFERLEMIADTLLSVNSPVQRAFPRWLEEAPAIRAQIQERLNGNRRNLERLLSGSPFQILPSQGGWNAVLSHPLIRDEEAFACALLEEQQVSLHPGFLFDFDVPGVWVLSLLPPPEIFEEGVRRLLLQSQRWCAVKATSLQRVEVPSG